MKRSLLFFLVMSICSVTDGQLMSVSNLREAVSLPSSKSNNLISKNGFALAGVEQQNDQQVHNYYFRGKSKKSIPDTLKRKITRQTNSKEISITYQTCSKEEFLAINAQVKEAGFICNKNNGDAQNIMMQQRNMTVRLCTKMEEEDTVYSFNICRKLLPHPKDILYADDLLIINSHEQLVHVFGPENVKKEIYFFSDNESSRCSVMFPNTDRQAVFIWADEVNDMDLSFLVIGGQLMVKSVLDYKMPVAQNNWILKNGIHTGMTLHRLRTLNGADIDFFGGKSAFTGMVKPDNSGKIDFKKIGVVLACLNCLDSRFIKSTVMNSEEAINEGSRFFVFAFILDPKTPNTE